MSEIKIFLASSSELKSDRDQFEIFINRRNKALRDQGIFLHLVIWEDFLDTISVDGLQSEYNSAIKDCDIFVILIHNKVGKYTAEEFDNAFGQFVATSRPRIFTYIKKPRTNEDREDTRSLWAFEDVLKKIKHYPTEYNNPDRLQKHFQDQLEKLAAAGFMAEQSSDGRVVEKGVMHKYRVPLQMPPLPDHFVERPEPQAAVRAQLLCENDKGGTLVVSAIYGLGGIGKSVLASKLTHDTAVQDYFADGILWVTLGQNPDILPLLSGWIQALGDHDYKPTAVESASNHLRTLLYDKCILLVVDDVWNPAHLEPFRVGGDKSRVMVTTREARIPDAELHRLDVMDEDQALDLMTQKIKEPLSERARGQALAFAGRVGYLPLALELAASQIEDGVTWPELLEDFTAEVSRLEALDIYAQGEMPDDEKRRKYSLLACFNLSLRQLSPEQLQQFAWLGVVPEDVSLTQAMAETLWQVSGRQAGSILRTFRAKSLVLQGAKQQGASEGDERPSYRMHDLMHDLARQLLQQPVVPEGEDGLPGLGLSVAAAHGELLDRYGAMAETGEDGQVLWHTLADDGYIFAHLTWHMARAQRPEAIHGLLCASNGAGRNGWYEACDAIGKPAGFVNDLGRAWAIAVESYEATLGETVALLYRYALMRGSLNSLASKVPAKMVGGLVKEGYWQVAQGLAYAQQAQEPWHRAECISAIVPYVPEALLTEVLKTVGQIKDAAYRSYVLSKLAERFPSVWADVLDTIQQIQDRYGNHRNQTEGFSYRALALSIIIKQLPVQYLSAAIDITRQIQDAADKATVLTKLAHLPEVLWPEALAITREIEDDSYRSSALSAMSEHLPEVLWPEALTIVREIEDDSYRSSALSAMAERLPELWPEALAITCEIEDDYSRSSALSAMAEHFPETLWPEALAITCEIEDDSYRSSALSAMAEHFPETLWPEALAIVREIEDDSYRSSALSAMAEYLPELWPEALAIVREIEGDSYRSRALIAMAEHLPETLWPEALAIAREIEDDYSRLRALIAMAEHLPEALWPETLAIAREIEGDYSRSRALIAMAEHLPETLWPEALAIVREIEDDSSRSSVLSAMAERLPDLWPEALAIAREIEDDYSRSSALSAMAEHFPETLWPETLAIVREIENDSYRLRALIVMAEHLPEALWPETLAIAREIEGDSYRSSALIAMAEHLPEALCPEALAIAREIEDDSSRSRALIAMAERLPELWPETLTIVREIEDDSSRSSALIAMAEYLPELWPEALAIVREIEDDFSRLSALIAMAEYLPELWLEALAIASETKEDLYRAVALQLLAEHLPDVMWPEALAIVREIENDSYRSSALSAMAEHLPEALWLEALAITREIEGDSSRSSTLSAMVEHLPEALWPEALTIVREIENDSYRSSALSAMAEYLPELWPEALAIVREIEDDYSRSSALSAMAEHLPEALWLEALAITRDIKDDSSRSSALSAMAEHLPEALWLEALAIIRDIKDDYSRSSALSAMAEHLPTNLISTAIAMIWDMQDNYFRAKALQAFLPALEHLSIPFPEWAKTLDIIAYQDRSELLEALPDIRPIVTRLGDDNTFPAILQAVRDVCQQWP